MLSGAMTCQMNLYKTQPASDQTGRAPAAALKPATILPVKTPP